jgi:hypothetical protein
MRFSASVIGKTPYISALNASPPTKQKCEVDESMAETGAIVAATHVSSSYRVKFKREQFLELVQIANPRTIYRRKRMHFFSFDGFVMYTFECQSTDFSQRVLDAIEFSNQPWSE